MKTKLKNIQERLVASYWVVPVAICVCAAAGAAGVLWYDRATADGRAPTLPEWITVGSIDGARELLSTIAGSTITLAGVIFSITILILSFASSHYGPRLLRNFMRDLPSQCALGTFVSTYLYCLLVLRTLGEGDHTSIPHAAVTGGLVLGMSSMGVLIFLVHHVARSIQVADIIHGVGADLDALIDTLIRCAERSDRLPEELSGEPEGRAHRVNGAVDGYVQAVSLENLVELAASHDGAVRLHVAAGDHVTAGARVATWYAKGREFSPEVLDAIRAAIVPGVQRTNEQDIEFPIDQLAEIAVRALSPGVNDPFTAIQCIDRLGGGLTRLAKVRWPGSVLRAPNDATPRVWQLPITMRRLLDRSFGQVLHYGGANPVIVRQVMKMLAEIAEDAVEPHRDAVVAYADELLVRSVEEGACGRLPDIRCFHRRIDRRGRLFSPSARRDEPRSAY